MKKFTTLEELFYHQLKVIYYAESQLLNALLLMRDKARNRDLYKTLMRNLRGTRDHLSQLERIGKMVNTNLCGYTCDIMKNLVQKATALNPDNTPYMSSDAGLIADAHHLLHYKISAYETALQYAKSLKNNEVINKLQQILNEEKDADQLLNTLEQELYQKK